MNVTVQDIGNKIEVMAGPAGPSWVSSITHSVFHPITADVDGGNASTLSSAFRRVFDGGQADTVDFTRTIDSNEL